jgi:hypothetical protein
MIACIFKNNIELTGKASFRKNGQASVQQGGASPMRS